MIATLEELEMFNDANARDRHCRIGKVVVKRHARSAMIDDPMVWAAAVYLVLGVLSAAYLLGWNI